MSGNAQQQEEERLRKMWLEAEQAAASRSGQGPISEEAAIGQVGPAPAVREPTFVRGDPAAKTADEGLTETIGKSTGQMNEEAPAIVEQPSPDAPQGPGVTQAGPADSVPSAPRPQMIPGGMMPAGLDTKAHLGKPVPESVRRAYNAAAGLEEQAAEIQQAADKKLFDQEKRAADIKIGAAEDAALQQRRIADERDAMARARLGEIEALNKQAAGRPEDLWSSETVFARFLSFALMATGVAIAGSGGGLAAGLPLAMGGKFIDGLINEDIQHKLDKREQAGKLAGRQTNLLNLHQERLNDQAKAVDATKLAYYDSVLGQLEKVRAEHKGDVNEANYLRLQSDILNERAKTEERLSGREAADIQQEFSQRYRQPQLVGGTAPFKDIPFAIRMPDGTVFAMPNEKQQNDSIAAIDAKQRLIRLNNRIQSLRANTEKLGVTDVEQRMKNLALLEELEQNKLKAMETAEHQGVLREGEYDRAKATTGYATEGLGHVTSHLPYAEARRRAAEAVLAEQTSRWSDDIVNMPRNAGGRVIKQGYMVDPMTGQLNPAAAYTGQDRGPTQNLAPQSFASSEGKPVPTAKPGDKDTTPTAPIFGVGRPRPAKKEK